MELIIMLYSKSNNVNRVINYIIMNDANVSTLIKNKGIASNGYNYCSFDNVNGKINNIMK